ncbi:hypothetical protein LCGC14_1198100 [marine sediment metagenome]|uniref:DNA methylase N-4/N-6 domain-containing protein n=1 Tax=marine sediment metagenome TaxID=412755 RepID=A0A0F9LHR3_9ZZZZ
MLTKTARYYWDSEAVREPVAPSTIGRGPVDFGGQKGRDYQPAADDPNYRGGNEQWGRTYEYKSGGRNVRTVWSFPSQPYPEAHFATFPEALPERCILAATPEVGSCSECGAPWTRVLSGGFTDHDGETESEYEVGSTANRLAKMRQAARANGGEYVNKRETTGWQPTCQCGADGLQPGDLDVIATPTGERVGPDPSMTTGRAGMNRPRGEDEGTSPMTRYEQRQYAAQIMASDYYADMANESGTAFAHYIRTDKAGARPVPPDILALWIERGWLSSVVVPSWTPPATVPSVVLDNFAGSGRTLWVAKRLGRKSAGYELSEEYCGLAVEGLRQQVLL